MINANIASLASVLAAALFLATVLERLVELLVKPATPEVARPVIPYAAAALGVLAAFAFSIDLITPTLANLDITPAAAWAGRALTGLLLGGGSNIIHDLWSEGGKRDLYPTYGEAKKAE